MAALQSLMQPGAILTLSGPLGAGKTTLVQALLQQMGVREQITSPTYAYVNTYTVDPVSRSGTTSGESGFNDVIPGLTRDPSLTIHHFDLYRVTSQEDFCSQGFEEYLHDEKALVIIEWPSIIASLLENMASRVVAVQLAYIKDDVDSRVLMVGEN